MLDDHNMNKVDKAFVAYLVVALYSRCRHSDLANVESVHLDFDDQGGFVEISTVPQMCKNCKSEKSVPSNPCSGNRDRREGMGEWSH